MNDEWRGFPDGVCSEGKADAVKWVAGVESLPATVERVPVPHQDA